MDAGRLCSQINSFVVGVKSQTSSPGRFSCVRRPLSTVYWRAGGQHRWLLFLFTANCTDLRSPYGRKTNDNANTGLLRRTVHMSGTAVKPRMCYTACSGQTVIWRSAIRDVRLPAINVISAVDNDHIIGELNSGMVSA